MSKTCRFAWVGCTPIFAIALLQSSLVFGSETIVKGSESKSTHHAVETRTRQEDPFLSRLDRWVRVIESSGDSDVLLEAMENLEPFGVDGQAAVPGLIKLLDHEDPEVKVAAADRLAEIGGPARAAIKTLAEMMQEEWMLGQNEPTSPRFGKALGKLGPEALPFLLEALDAREMRLFAAGAEGLAELGKEAKPALPELIELLQSKERLRQWGAAYVIESIGPDAEDAIPYLGALLKHESFQQHVIGSRAIAAIGPPANRWAAELFDLLKNGNSSSRGHAAMALGAIGPVEGVDFLEVLIERSTEFSDPVRERSLVGIGRLGPKGTAAADHLRELLADSDYRNRPQAALSLWKITGETELPVNSLVSMFDDLTYQLAAIDNLGEMGAAAEAAVDPLINLAVNGDEDLSYEAIRSLGRIGTPAKKAIPALEKLKESEDLWIAGVAHEAIKRINEAN